MATGDGEQLPLPTLDHDATSESGAPRESPGGTLDGLRNMADAAARELSAAQQAMARLSLRSRTLENLSSTAGSGRYCTAHLDAVKASRRSEFTAGEQSLLSEFAAKMREQATRTIRGLPDTLPRALESAGLALHPTSRHPRYQVGGEFITVTVDDKALNASVASRGGPVRRVPADADAITEAAVAIHQRLFGEDRTRMTMESLVSAYRSVVERQSVSMGAEVPIESVREAVPPIRGKALPQDEFNVDLAALLAAPHDKRWRVSFANTRQTERGVLIHGMESTGYVGYIKVEERHG